MLQRAWVSEVGGCEASSLSSVVGVGVWCLLPSAPLFNSSSSILRRLWEERVRLTLRTLLLRVAEVADVDGGFLLAMTALGEVGRVVEDASGGNYDVA